MPSPSTNRNFGCWTARQKLTQCFLQYCLSLVVIFWCPFILCKRVQKSGCKWDKSSNFCTLLWICLVWYSKSCGVLTRACKGSALIIVVQSEVLTFWEKLALRASWFLGYDSRANTAGQERCLFSLSLSAKPFLHYIRSEDTLCTQGFYHSMSSG